MNTSTAKTLRTTFLENSYGLSRKADTRAILSAFADSKGWPYMSETAYGFEGEYPVCVRAFGAWNQFIIYIPVAADNKQIKIAIQPLLNDTYLKSLGLYTYIANPSLAMLMLKLKKGVEPNMAISTLINAFTATLSSADMHPICVGCGTVGSYTFTDDLGVIYPSCTTCAEHKEVEAAALRTAIETEGHRYGAGIAGAIVGGLVGSILWIIIFQLGFISGWGGLAIGAAAYYGYKKMGGRPGKATPWIIGIVALVIMLLANVLSYAIAIMIEESSIGLGNALLLSVMVMPSEPDSGFWTNVGLGALFTLIGCFGLLRRAKKEADAANASIQR